MRVSKETQLFRLAEYLLCVEPKITPLVAQKVLGIERLASRIWDLKQAGVEVTKRTKTDYAGKRYTEYILA